MKALKLKTMLMNTARAVALGLTALLGTALSAQDYMGPLDGLLPESGPDGVWQIESNAQGFGMENAQSPGDIRYYYAASRSDEEGQRRIEVELTFNGSSQGMGMGGILYGFDPSNGNYFIFGLESDGSVSLYRRDQDGMRPMSQTSSSALRRGRNTLTLIERGSELSYQVNGQALGSIANSHTGRGQVGIAVAGFGQTVFHRFSVATGQGDLALGDLPPSSRPPSGLPAADGGAEASLPQSDASRIEFRRVEIMDDNGPFGRQVAMRTLVPADWVMQGGVKWGTAQGQNACFRSQRLIWGAGTSDESFGMVFLDPLSWGVSNFGPVGSACLQQDLVDAEAVARSYLQMLSGQINNQITEVHQPAEVEALVRLFRQTHPPMNLPGTRTWFDGVAVNFTSESEGVSNDGVMILVSRHDEASSQNAMGHSGFRMGQTMMVLVMTTPRGHLEAGHPAFGVILNNIQPDPQWSRAVAQWHAAQRPAPGQPRSMPVSTNSADTSIGDMMFESWQRRNDMNSAGQQRSIDGIREVQPWQTSTGTVRLSQNYNHAWELQNGNLVLTNNANFDPMQTFNQFGEPLRRAN